MTFYFNIILKNELCKQKNSVSLLLRVSCSHKLHFPYISHNDEIIQTQSQSIFFEKNDFLKILFLQIFEKFNGSSRTLHQPTLETGSQLSTYSLLEKLVERSFEFISYYGSSENSTFSSGAFFCNSNLRSQNWIFHFK